MLVLGIAAGMLLMMMVALYLSYRFGFYYRDENREPLDYKKTENKKKLEVEMDAAIIAFQGEKCEEVAIQSFDGLRLTGRYYPGKEGAPLQIWCHGYKGNAIQDFCGAWPMAKAMGHHVLLIDERAHRTSQGHTITFGIREHRDVIAWVEYVCQRFGAIPIGLMGVSMGAATVLMAAGREMPNNVKCVVADCPYDAPDRIVKKVIANEMKMKAGLMYPLARFSAMVFGHFDLEAWSPLEAVKKTSLPILLIHGEEDHFVPCEMSRNIKDASGDKAELHTIPHSPHALNQLTNPEMYAGIYTAFLQKHLG